jgi:hypothetical protein
MRWLYDTPGILMKEGQIDSTGFEDMQKQNAVRDNVMARSTEPKTRVPVIACISTTC